MQAPVAQFNAFEFTAQQPAREMFQPPVEFLTARGEPLIGGRGQAQLGSDGGYGSRRQQVAIEAAIVR